MFHRKWIQLMSLPIGKFIDVSIRLFIHSFIQYNDWQVTEIGIVVFLLRKTARFMNIIQSELYEIWLNYVISKIQYQILDKRKKVSRKMISNLFGCCCSFSHSMPQKSIELFKWNKQWHVMKSEISEKQHQISIHYIVREMNAVVWNEMPQVAI